jgi:tetratricopeptide (TPR) repeat protein
LALSNLPDRNPFFTDREDVLAQLQEALSSQGRAALSGLGGVGKTQTAVEYAHRHLDEYVYTLWATADSREALVSGYVTIAGLLKLPAADSQDQTLAVDAVKRWLGSHQDWLLILDNADDLAMTRESIPHGNTGHVLLTTRARATGAVARLVEIQEMGIEEGALFLLRRAKYIAEDAVLESADEDDRARAKEIVAQLDGLPLALDQAAAYIEETGCGFPGYLELYRRHALELLGLRGALTSDHLEPVATTWALSFEKIEKANQAAAELLRFCAFLHPDQIPEEVFSKGAPELGPVLGPVGSDAFGLNNSISEILKYSLLRRDANARILEIHRLVQTVLKRGMDEAVQRLWAERAVRAINCAFPFVEFSMWAGCDRLLPQAHACAELINEWDCVFSEAASLLRRTGWYLLDRGRYIEAEPLYQRALAIWEKAAPSPKNPNIALGLDSLALLYTLQGRYAEAEPLFKRALAIWERALGPEHPSVAAGLNNLAELYRTQRQYPKAEPLLKRALAIFEKAQSPQHRMAKSLHNLAVLYHDQGRYAEAEPLHKRVRVILERALGSDHPDVAASLNNLARLYHSQGRYAEAEPLYKRALAIREKALGREHADVATSLNNLAMLYYNQDQYKKAEPLYQRSLAIREKALGPDHPHVGTCLENYALLLRKMDRPDEAEPLESRATAIRDKAPD